MYTFDETFRSVTPLSTPSHSNGYPNRPVQSSPPGDQPAILTCCFQGARPTPCTTTTSSSAASRGLWAAGPIHASLLVRIQKVPWSRECAPCARSSSAAVAKALMMEIGHHPPCSWDVLRHLATTSKITRERNPPLPARLGARKYTTRYTWGSKRTEEHGWLSGSRILAPCSPVHSQ